MHKMPSARSRSQFSGFCFVFGSATVTWFVWHKYGWDWGVLAIGCSLILNGTAELVELCWYKGDYK